MGTITQAVPGHTGGVADVVVLGGYETVSVTLVTDTNAYADNDVLVIPQEVTNFFPVAGGTRVLHSVHLLDEADQGQDIDLIFMDANGTLGTINSAVSINDTDAAKVIGKVSLLIADYTDLVNSMFATKGNLATILTAASGSRSLWIGAVLRSGTPTYAAASLKLKLGVS